MFTGISLFLLLVALVFIILATVTAPVAKTLSLAAADNIVYGIFGFCDGSVCPKAGYPIKFGNIKTSADWAMSSDLRNTLASGFIVAPIAAGLTFLTLILTAANLFMENTVVKTLSLIFGVISFLAAAVICIFVVLVFHPHVAWAGWLLVAAAGLLLVGVPCLILSVGVNESSDLDSVATEEKHLANYTKITESSFSSEPKHHYFGTSVAPKGSSTDDMSEIVRDYTYRGTVKPEFTTTDNALGSFVSKPNARGANESLGTSKSSVYQDSLVNFSQIPSKPIASNQSVAPNFQSSSAVPGNIKPRVPYPSSERGSVLNAASYGVFDHHPSVEGHKPFTELDDDDDNDRNSMLPGQRELDSDDDSDFTSVSQRPPNVMYNAQHPQQQQQQQPFRGQPGQFHPQQQQPHPQQQQPYQQQYPNVSQYQPSFQQAQPPSPQNAYYGNGAPPAGLQQSQQRPPQQYGQQYSYGSGSGSRGSPRGPTISDSVLNTNPDFAVGPASRRKPGRPQQGQPQGGAFPNRPARRGPTYGTRDPYSAF